MRVAGGSPFHAGARTPRRRQGPGAALERPLLRHKDAAARAAQDAVADTRMRRLRLVQGNPPSHDLLPPPTREPGGQGWRIKLVVIIFKT